MIIPSNCIPLNKILKNVVKSILVSDKCLVMIINNSLIKENRT